MAFYDRIKTVAATANGAGNITWTVAADRHALPPTSISETVIYTVEDSGGTVWETGRAALSESGGTFTLARSGAQTVTAGSSGAGTPVSLTNSSAHTLILAPDAQFFDAIPGTTQVIESYAPSAVSTLDIELPASGAYDELTLELSDVTVSSDGAKLTIVVSDDDQSTWETGASYYLYAYQYGSSSGADDTANSTGEAFIQIGAGSGNAAGESANGHIYILNPYSSSQHTVFRTHMVIVGPTTTVVTHGMGKVEGSTNEVTGVQLGVDSGTFSGTIKLKGRVV